MHAQLLQLCLTLRDPMDHSLAASSIHGRFPVRIPEWVAISSSGDFPHPGLNPCLLHLLHGRQILYLLSHWGSLYNPYFKIYLYLSHYLFSTISHLMMLPHFFHSSLLPPKKGALLNASIAQSVLQTGNNMCQPT